LPDEFLQGDEIPADKISKVKKKSLDASAFSLPRHISSCQLLSELPADILSPSLIWVRCSGLVPLSTLSSTAPMPSSAKTPRLHSAGRATGGDHRREPPQGMHGRGRHTWQPTMPRQTAGSRRDSYVGCRPSRRSSCHQACLIFRLADIFTIIAGASENSPRNSFSPTPPPEVFARPGLTAPL
jgi:hypothetical protein